MSRQGSWRLGRRLDPRRWPLLLTVPLTVAALVAGVATLTGQAVLARLKADQERHLAALGSAFLDGLATAVQPAAVWADIWEAFDALDRASRQYEALRPTISVLVLPDGSVLASSSPRVLRTGAALPEPLSRLADQAAAIGSPAIEEEFGRAVVARVLLEGGVPVGRLVAEADIGALLAERNAVVRTLILANLGIAAFFAAAGALLVRRILLPTERLRQRLLEAAMGRRPEPLDAQAGSGSEHLALVNAWNGAVAAIAERDLMAARLAREEGRAQLGRLTAAMAHEVNNPLGGLMTAVDTISEYGDRREIREEAVGLLRRGLDDIRKVVRAGLSSWKTGPGEAPLAAQDFEDLRLLIRHEVSRRGLTLDWRNDLPGGVRVDRTLARQIALNLLLNAAAASPPKSVLSFRAQGLSQGGAVIEVSDVGTGLPADAESLLTDPEGLPPSGGGLGLWTAARLARSQGGRITREPTPRGTRLVAELPVPSHGKEVAHAS